MQKRKKVCLILYFFCFNLVTSINLQAKETCLGKWVDYSEEDEDKIIDGILHIGSIIASPIGIYRLHKVLKSIKQHQEIKLLFIYPYLNSPEEIINKNNNHPLYQGGFHKIEKKSKATMLKFYNKVYFIAQINQINKIPSLEMLEKALKNINEIEGKNLSYYCHPDDMSFYRDRVFTGELFQKANIPFKTLKFVKVEGVRSFESINLVKFHLFLKKYAQKKGLSNELPPEEEINKALKIVYQNSFIYRRLNGKELVAKVLNKDIFEDAKKLEKQGETYPYFPKLDSAPSNSSPHYHLPSYYNSYLTRSYY